MSLTGTLNIARTGLAVNQSALQVTGNNIANAGNADYTRQVSRLSTAPDQQIRPGVFVGQGVNLTGIERQIDEALQTRIRASVSDHSAADTTQSWLSRVEATFNELSDEDLSTLMSKFFGSWSSLANKPQDLGLRQVVIQSGESVTKWFNNLGTSLSNLQGDVDARLEGYTADANNLAQQVADLNKQIALAEGIGAGKANGLRDQRDQALKSLSELIDIKTQSDDRTGVVNVYVNSTPLVLGTTNNGVGLRQENNGDHVETTVVFKSDNGTMNVTAGTIGALVATRKTMEETSDRIDNVAGSLVFQLNKLHSSGQGLSGFSAISSTNNVDDATVALNSDATNLAFKPQSGSFVVHVKNKTTGLTESTLVQLDLDGLNGNDTTLTNLKDSLAAIPNVSATLAGGQLRLASTSPNVELSFSQDSSGVLAALGVNNFFTGTRAVDVKVDPKLKADPTMLAAARNGEKGDNQTALAIAQLESQPIDALSGKSMKEAYQSLINDLAAESQHAKINAQASEEVRDTLISQREALSGVSLDEEAVNLMKYQRGFQGAAKLITTVNEMMDTILNIVR